MTNSKVFENGIFKLKEILQKNAFSQDKIKEELENLTFTSILKFKEKFITKLFIKALFIGNILKQNVTNFVNKTLNFEFSPSKNDIYSEQLIDLRKKSLSYRIINSKKNHLIINYYQIGKREIRNFTKLFFIIDNLEDTARISYLKANLPIDYMTKIEPFSEAGIDGILIIMESFYRNPYLQDEYIEEILQKYELVLSNFTKEEFHKMKNNALKNIENSDFNLKQVGNKFWNEIRSNYYQFDRKEKMKIIFESLQIDEIISFYKFKNININIHILLIFFIIG